MIRKQDFPDGQADGMEWSEMTPGERFLIRISSEETAGAYAMLEMEADQGYGTPMHIYERNDAHFVIVAGEARFAYGESTASIPAGASLTVRKGIPHAWGNLSDGPLRMLVTFTPGGIDELFRIIAKGGDINFPALLERFGCPIVGPPVHADIKPTSGRPA
ncbi:MULTISPECIES: cupin domain-containing protein [unclassified Sinorhizobium]|uniref:cupin domain-containing protein n=1 Tax=unclassified Sinorhizobium TaxID=2613772 RepID=UPI0035260576